MGYDVYSILALCGVSALGFWLVGSASLWVAVRIGRAEFRTKGYLKKRSVVRWLRFLLFKEYDYIENTGSRVYFLISHFCFVAMIIVLTAVVLLLGCEVLLRSSVAG